jgi:hypothetical protein
VSASPSGGRFAIAVSTYYKTLAERLLEGARAELRDAGVEDVEVHAVPGAFELPMAARLLAASGRFAGVVCLGAVLRGETKALALGARALLVGRAYLWGLAASGERGVLNVLEILRSGIEETLGALGRPSVADLWPADLLIADGFFAPGLRPEWARPLELLARPPRPTR